MTDYENIGQHDNGRNETGAALMVSQLDDSLLSAMARQWGAAPWYTSSFLLHIVIIAVILLFTPPVKKATRVPFIVVADNLLLVDETPPIDTTPPPAATVEDPKDSDAPEIVMVPKPNIPEPMIVNASTEDETPVQPEDKTDFNGVGDADTVTMSTPGLGVSHGPKATNGYFRKRGEDDLTDITRRRIINVESMNAIKEAQAWLARTQEPGGNWDCARYEGRNHDIAVTALAQLAFLATGNSARAGTYRKTVKASQDYLLSKRDEQSGRIGSFQYEAAITMMAMAEAWGMSDDRRLAAIVQAQVDDAQKYQNANGGWGYKTESDPITAHVDTSVAGWWMMGMKSAKVAGAQVSEQSWDKARSYFRSVAQTNKDDTVTSGYVGKGDSVNMTAVGLTCLQFLGFQREDPLVKGQADFFMKHQEHMINNRTDVSNPYYGWYYQAMGMYQMGTQSPYWKKFSPQMQAVMLSLQEKTGADRGSWPIRVPWQQRSSNFEEQVGRVGTTAVGCLIISCFRDGDTHANPTIR